MPHTDDLPLFTGATQQSRQTSYLGAVDAKDRALTQTRRSGPKPKPVLLKNCLHCGEVMARRVFASCGLEAPSLYSKRQFCSMTCSGAAQSKAATEKRLANPSRPKPLGLAILGSIRPCVRCRQPFTITEVSRRKRWYACDSCIRAAARKSFADCRVRQLARLRARRHNPLFLNWEKTYRENLSDELRVRRGARQSVYKALRRGRLRKEPCCRCGSEHVQAHHADYTKRLEVTWLCAICHGLEHRKDPKPSAVREMETSEAGR